jgi:dihydropyrimidinase
MFDLIIASGTVVTAEHQFEADIAITGGRIAALGQDLGPAREVLDASGRLVLPGGADPHCHIEQLSGMGLMNADTFETATASAAMGGTTSVISFAAQKAGERLRDTVADYAARARRGARIDHAFHLMITDIDAPNFEDDLTELVAGGHKSLKIFTTYNIGLEDKAILHVLRLAKAAGALVCVHAENDALIKATTARLLEAGLTRPEHHALSHPRAAEIEAVERMCHFADYLDQPVMLFHISTLEAVEVVRNARARGVPVWAETCPHYLMMTAQVLRRDGLEGAKFMCSPPQREAADQQALWAGLSGGTLDLISSDHAPYRFDETGKLSAGPNARFDQIANGLPGLEVRLPLLFDAVMRRGDLSLQDFVEWTATGPARLYGLASKGRIAVGCDADLVLWDSERSVTYAANDLHDNVGYNPWEGHSVTGWPETVLLRGKVIVADGELRAKPGQGAWLARELATLPRGKAAPEWAAAQGAI